MELICPLPFLKRGKKVFCNKCGQEIKEGMKFCSKCGAEVSEPIKISPVKQKNKKKFLWIVIIVVVIIAIIIATLIALRTKKEKKYQSFLTSANKYLEEMNYEKAEDSFLKAIKIDPKVKEPYMQLVDLYMEQEKTEKAVAILKKAVEYVDVKKEENQDILQRYNLYTYVDEVLIPKEGKCEEGIYTCEYTQTNNFLTVNSVHSEKGVLNWTINDFDNDGTEELLVLMLKNQEKAFELDEVERNAVYLQMYANVDGTVELKDEYMGLCPILGSGDNEDDGIFLKKANDKIYICGSNTAYTHFYADGLMYRSFIVSYADGAFIEEGGDLKIKEVYDLMNNENVRIPMIQKLNEIGLEKEANRIEEDSRPYFTFIDDMDQVMLRIVGSTDGDSPSYYFTSDVNSLGTINLEVKTGELENKLKEFPNDSDAVDKNKAQNNVTEDESTQRPDNTEVVVSLEDKIQKIRSIYYGIQDKKNSYQQSESEGFTYFVNNGSLKEIIVSPGTYEESECTVTNQYTAEFYYEENQLVFTFVYGQGEEHRYYMDNGKCIRYIDQDGQIYDYDSGMDVDSLTHETADFCGLGIMEPHWCGFV